MNALKRFYDPIYKVSYSGSAIVNGRVLYPILSSLILLFYIKIEYTSRCSVIFCFKMDKALQVPQYSFSYSRTFLFPKSTKDEKMGSKKRAHYMPKMSF